MGQNWGYRRDFSGQVFFIIQLREVLMIHFNVTSIKTNFDNNERKKEILLKRLVKRQWT